MARLRPFIRDLNVDPRLRNVTGDRRPRDMIHTNGDPLIHQGLEEAYRHFDWTGRTLHCFLCQCGG
jgi:hypothetical protein